jgi:hypothetical protein
VENKKKEDPKWEEVLTLDELLEKLLNEGRRDEFVMIVKTFPESRRKKWRDRWKEIMQKRESER